MSDTQKIGDSLIEQGWTAKPDPDDPAATIFIPPAEEAGDVNRSDGLGDDALGFVQVVEVFGRDDGIYVFDALSPAERFAQAVEAGGGEYSRRETPINSGQAAGRLIFAERGDVLEALDWPALAEDCRSGVVPGVLLERLREQGDGDSAAAVYLDTWAQLDHAALLPLRERLRAERGKLDADEALDRLAARLNEPGECRGADMVELVAEVVVASGREVSEGWG